jgi:hypothetical protein
VAPYSAISHALVSDLVPLSEQHFADEQAIDRISIRPVNIRHSAMCVKDGSGPRRGRPGQPAMALLASPSSL